MTVMNYYVKYDKVLVTAQTYSLARHDVGGEEERPQDLAQRRALHVHGTVYATMPAPTSHQL